MDNTKTDELQLFSKWKSTGDKSHFQDLYRSMKPLLASAATKASAGSNLPRSAHEIWAAQNFYDALKTFNPNKGVTLQTHVYGAVHQKAKRLNYMYQNLGKISEPRAVQVGLFNTVKSNLSQELKREPSAAEIADNMGISIRDVSRLQVEIQKDLSLSNLEEQVIVESPKEEEALAFLYYEIGNEEKVVYDYVFGKHGKIRAIKPNGKIDFAKIARSAGMSESKVRSLFSKIKEKYEKVAR